MRPTNVTSLLTELSILKAPNDLTADRLQRLIAHLPSASLDKHSLRKTTRRKAIRVLCELATADDHSLNEVGRHFIFSLLVERLSDSFKPECVSQLDQLLAQIIDFCRRIPAGRTLHRLLNRFGIKHEQDLLRRKARIKRPRIFSPLFQKHIKKLFVLSRVTLGAEVAVTSVVLQKLKHVFPDVEITLFAPAQVKELFGGDPQINIAEVTYPRQGALLERFQAWIALVDAVDQKKRGLRSQEYLVVDPDSRVTQLGLLPVTETDAAYYFFESRNFRKPGIGSISQLTASWLDDVFGPGDDPLYPYVRLPRQAAQFGKELCQQLRLGGAQHIVTINFGVGDNPRKRISDAFEVDLVAELLNAGNVIILDKGIGEEIGRANKIIAMLRERGRNVVELNGGTMPTPPGGNTIRCDVLAWQGSIGTFSSLIAGSDLYIGYDSAFQHIAAALGVPLIDIFAYVPTTLFAHRWQPYGSRIRRVVKLNSQSLDRKYRAAKDALAQVLGFQREIKDLRFQPEPR